MTLRMALARISLDLEGGLREAMGSPQAGVARWTAQETLPVQRACRQRASRRVHRGLAECCHLSLYMHPLHSRLVSTGMLTRHRGQARISVGQATAQRQSTLYLRVQHLGKRPLHGQPWSPLVLVLVKALCVGSCSSKVKCVRKARSHRARSNNSANDLSMNDNPVIHRLMCTLQRPGRRTHVWIRRKIPRVCPTSGSRGKAARGRGPARWGHPVWIAVAAHTTVGVVLRSTHALCRQTLRPPRHCRAGMRRLHQS